MRDISAEIGRGLIRSALEYKAVTRSKVAQSVGYALRLSNRDGANTVNDDARTVASFA